MLLEDEGVLKVSFPREPKEANKQIEIEVEKGAGSIEEGGVNGGDMNQATTEGAKA